MAADGAGIEVQVISDKLPDLLAAMPEAVALIVQHAAEAMTAAAQGNAPVRTGYLRDHIHTEMTGEAEATITSEAPYSGFVENGTSRMGAQPFFTPAVEANTQDYLDAFHAIETLV